MTLQNKPPKPPKEEQPSFEHPQPQSNHPSLGQIPGVATPDEVLNKISTNSAQISEMQNKRVNLNTDIIGLFETVSVAPTGVPLGPWGQIKIYVNGATLRLYWYDGKANVWHYVTATA